MLIFFQRVFLTLFTHIPLLLLAETEADDFQELSNYQEVNRLWIGLAEGIIEPTSLEAIKTQVEGYYLIEARDGDWLQKDQHWLTMEPNKLDLEKQELELEEKKAKEVQRKALIEKSEELQRLGEKLEEIVEEQRLLNEALAEERQSELLSAGLEERVQTGQDKLEIEAERIRELMKPEIREAAKLLADKEQALQLERKRLSLLALENRSKIKAPFEGMLELSTAVKELLLENKDSGGLIWLPPATGIGLITDRTSYIVRIPSEGTQLPSIPQEKLRIMITSKEEGKLISADLLRVIKEQRGEQASLIYEFKISKEEAESLTLLSQQKTIAHLFRTFDSPCRVIPKRDIAFEDTAALQSGGWKKLVKELWPNVELIAVGPQHLAVRRKE